ncbi:MAG: cytochrome c [Ectothiorhodospiraceae bacterium]|jgi:mono/diheme cytochrome c family protein
MIVATGRHNPAGAFARAALFLGAICLAQSVSASGDRETEIGKDEFMNNCASCHGPDGKGDGPLAGQLTKKPFDLTQMSANNGGQFPFFQTYDIIAGTRDVSAHGGREMPVWGSRFRVEAEREYNRFGPDDPETVVQGRILRLVYYLRSIQSE